MKYEHDMTGAKFEAARRGLGLDQKCMARLAGVTLAKLQKIERCKKPVRWDECDDRVYWVVETLEWMPVAYGRVTVVAGVLP